MRPNSIVNRFSSIIVTLLICSVAAAEEEAPVSLQDALLKGKINFNLRLRAEIVEQDGLDGARAFTERIRLGYGTQTWNGLMAYVEMEDIRSADDDRYFDGTPNGSDEQGNKAVVADPEDTELNQFYIKYTWEWVTVIAGRQRIILDNARFVGNVGWRQNEQTFDAYTLKAAPIENLQIFYSYVADVNRIFGPDSEEDFKSDSHLVNVSYSNVPVLGKIVLFAYCLDLDSSPVNSSSTYGGLVTGSNPLAGEDLSIKHLLSYAIQQENGDNTTDYEADYYMVDLSVARKGLGSVGAGYEVLGADDDSSGGVFRTPLATLHAFNGWADAFLITPSEGLQDLYFYAGTSFWGMKAKIVKHFYSTDDGCIFDGSKDNLGQELDAVLSKKINQNVSALVKAAWFNGKDLYADRAKVWLQTDISF